MTAKLQLCTGIDPKALHDGNNLGIFSIAERMSWAASRKTSRVEDEAYCLMGLFDINMPLIYGEGRKAFVRLQEELLTKSDDASIFAYLSREQPSLKEDTVTSTDVGLDIVVSEVVDFDPDMDEQLVPDTTGLFASSPTYYRDGAAYVPYRISCDTPHLRLQIRKIGNVVQLPVVLWELPLQELTLLSRDISDSSVQADIFRKSGITLTIASVKKLRTSLQDRSKGDWAIAFIGCQRRDGGVIGMLIRQDFARGVYIRQHFPSLVETVSVQTFLSRNVGQCCNIEIEAGVLRSGQKDCAMQSSKTSKLLGDARVKTIVRAPNLRKYGISDDEGRNTATNTDTELYDKYI